MSDWTHRTIIVAAQDVALARSLCASVADGDAGKNMLTTALSPTGTGAATHYVSAGLVWPSMAALLGDTAATHAAAGGQVTLAAIEGMYARATISEAAPHSVMAEAGLKMITT